MDLEVSSQRGSGGRSLSVLVGAVVIGLAAWLSLESGSARSPKEPTPIASSAAPDAAVAAQPSPTASAEVDAGVVLPSLWLDDGGLSLPSSAPRTVKLGVVLVAFAGAEGAPPSARSRKDAMALATRLASDASADFHKAVASGDSGSADDIGRIPRGVLDPRTEVAVFGLRSGEVSGVLETARGFWIVKRID